jgi:hypothetical protein
MRVLRGLGHSKIAKTLGISPELSRKRLSAAKAQLTDFIRNSAKRGSGQ